jgi:hypothetical protein
MPRRNTAGILRLTEYRHYVLNINYEEPVIALKIHRNRALGIEKHLVILDINGGVKLYHLAGQNCTTLYSI